jgi:hypothetical protein
MMTNRIVDLIGQNMDISLRIGLVPDAAFVVREIADFYELFVQAAEAATWPFRVNDNLITVDVEGASAADSAEMLLKLPIEG